MKLGLEMEMKKGEDNFEFEMRVRKEKGLLVSK